MHNFFLNFKKLLQIPQQTPATCEKELQASDLLIPISVFKRKSKPALPVIRKIMSYEIKKFKKRG